MRVVIFIDGIGGETTRAVGLDNLFARTRPLRTGIGYTVNIITEVFAGLTPDQAGFFNKWGIAPDRAPLRRRPALGRCLSPLEHWPWADLRVRRALRRRGTDTCRIPWRMCSTFGKIGTDVAHGPNTPRSIFADGRIGLAHPRGMPGADNDAAVADIAERSIRDGRDTAVFFTYLDGLGHDHGPYDDRYLERAAWYRDRIARLIEVARDVDPRAAVILFSDHSMLPVTFHVRPPAIPRGVLAFVDATIMRLWAGGRRSAAVGDVVGELVSGGRACALTDQDRRRFGVTRPSWGDAIVLLEPGGLFVPDYFTGIHRPATATARGMHGYHPDRRETDGVYFTLGVDGAGGADGGQPVTTLDAHRAIRQALRAGQPT